VDVAGKIQKLREEAGLSKNLLAKQSSVAQSYISEIESNKKQPSIEVLDKICKVFNITLGQFFADEDQLQYAPPDIAKFAIDPKNQPLIRTIQRMQEAGYSNEMIEEWNAFLVSHLKSYVEKYGILNRVSMAADDITEEEKRVIEKLNKKLYGELKTGK